MDPVLAMVLAVLEKYPDGWTGTVSQLFAEGSSLADCAQITSPEAVGKRLPAIHPALAKRGYVWQKNSRIHRFSRQEGWLVR